MNWILITWIAFSPASVDHVMTFEECKARGEQHIRNSDHWRSPKAFCLRRDGGSVVQIERGT